MTLTNIKESIKDVLSKYLLELRKNWEASNGLTVRISQIEARILDIEGILDITDTSINTGTSNVEVAKEYIPVLGTVEVTEVLQE